jgi:hypothetical protein
MPAGRDCHPEQKKEPGAPAKKEDSRAKSFRRGMEALEQISLMSGPSAGGSATWSRAKAVIVHNMGAP